MKNNKLKIGIVAVLIILLAVFVHTYKITSSSVYDQEIVDSKYVKNFDSDRVLEAKKAVKKIYDQEVQTSIIKKSKVENHG